MSPLLQGQAGRLASGRTGPSTASHSLVSQANGSQSPRVGAFLAFLGYTSKTAWGREDFR